MITSKLVYSISIFIIVCSVSCADEDSVKVRNLARRSRQRYRYNHPPSAENDEIIPVAVVYDKVIDRSSRNHKTPKDTELEIKTETPTETILTTAPVQKENIDTTPKENSETEVTTKRNRSRTRSQRLKNRRSRPVGTEQNIPVAIVYDQEIDRNSRQSLKSQDVAATPEHGNKITKSEVSTFPTTNKYSDKLFTENKAPEPKQLHLEFKIPVSVVYDDETTGFNGNFEPVIRKKGAKNRIITKVRKQLKNFPNPNSELKDTTNVKTSEVNDKVHLKSEPETGLTNKPKAIESSKVNLESTDALSKFQQPENGKKGLRKRKPVVPIIESENRLLAQTGGFMYSYEGGDGTKAFSNGVLKTFDEDRTGEAVVGGFSYKDKDGNDFSLTYTADENGYRPVGAHLPTPPPIPPEIARALEHLATKTTPEPVTEALDAE